jgi:hypothetical protein
MRLITRALAVPFTVAGIGAALLGAPVAAAAPNCVDTGPTTTQCTTGGSTSIVTSPPAMNYGPQYGWGWGGFGIFL